MKSLADGTLRRVTVDDDEDEESFDADSLSLGDLSGEDLADSEDDESHDDLDASGVDEAAIEDDLAEIPFGTLMEAQASFKAETSKPESSRRPSNGTRIADSKLAIERKSLKRKRDNKHAPTELSSKKPVGRSREAVEVVKIERRDPRFDPDLNSKASSSNSSKHAYGFLEDYRKDEMRMLKQQIAKEKDTSAKAQLEKTLRSMQSREHAAKERERRERVLSQFKRKEKEAAKDGKIPFHLKESEKNKLYLKDKFDSMKDSKALNKVLEKKRKRRSQKERRALPT